MVTGFQNKLLALIGGRVVVTPVMMPLQGVTRIGKQQYLAKMAEQVYPDLMAFKTASTGVQLAAILKPANEPSKNQSN